MAAWLVLGCWQVAHVLRSDGWNEPPHPYGDGPDYESIATSLSRGEGFQFAWQDAEWQRPYREAEHATEYTQLDRTDWPGPTASRPPGLPSIIALVYCVVPRGSTAFACIRVLQALCLATSAAIAVGWSYRCTARWHYSTWAPQLAACLALALALLDRTIRTYAMDFLTEPWALLLVTLFWALAIESLGASHPYRWSVAMGLCLGLLILTRSIAVFWLPGLAIFSWLAVPRRFVRARLRIVSVFVFCSLLVVSPWWIRNMRVLDAWMPWGGQGSASLRGGYSDEALNDWGNWHPEPESRIQTRIDEQPESLGWTAAQREVRLAELASAETRAWVSQNAWNLPRLIGMRIASHWGPYSGASLIWRLGVVAGWLVVFSLRRREAIWILGLPLVSTCTVALLYETGGRFLVPLYSLLYLTAAVGATHCLAAAIAGFRKETRLR
jgi:4-amino-4-deoxy-L-arabinose transferase-like glycosyltransferase